MMDELDMISVEKKAYSLKLNKSSGNIVQLIDRGDKSATNIVDETGGRFGAVVYTESNTAAQNERNPESDSFIRLGEKFADLGDGSAESDIIKDTCQNCEHYIFENSSLKSKLEYSFEDDYITVYLHTENNNMNEVGIEFDLNFMDTNQTLPFEHQYLPSLPYSNKDGSLKYFAMNRPDGRWILFLCNTYADGWRIRYDHDNCHILKGFQLLRRFDSVFCPQPKTDRLDMSVSISFHNSIEQVHRAVIDRARCPVLVFPVSGGVKGTALPVLIKGEYRNINILEPDNNSVKPLRITVLSKDESLVVIDLKKEGLYSVEAVGFSGKKSDCTFYCYPGWAQLMRRATDRIEEPYHGDFNLCEAAMWAWALLVRFQMFGKDKFFSERLNSFFKEKLIVNPDKDLYNYEGCVVPFPHEFDGKTFSQYHLYKTVRLQNQVTAALILLEAYKVYRDEKYIDFAARYIMNLIRDHLSQKGELLTDHCGGPGIDYSTVTACIIGFVDTANALQAGKDERWKTVKEAALKIADNLLQRGIDFPTEAIQGRRETEDGSISCTALSLLYAYMYLDRNEQYLQKAGEILALHDSWCINTPDARMYKSTLRWWENNWEGDADGSSINAGHAWTLWKGEADFLYACATGEFERAVSSFNAYMTNLSKVSESGKMFTCYTPDYIPGKPQKGRIVHGYPIKDNRSVPHYLWARARDTWFCASGIGSVKGSLLPINGYYEVLESGIRFVTAAENLRHFFIGDFSGILTIETRNSVQFICTCKQFKINNGYLELENQVSKIIIPDNGVIQLVII